MGGGGGGGVWGQTASPTASVVDRRKKAELVRLRGGLEECLLHRIAPASTSSAKIRARSREKGGGYSPRDRLRASRKEVKH